MTVLTKQSSTQVPLMFFLTASSDHISGLTGASPAVTISKNGGSFTTPSGAISEIANGWYKGAPNANDSNTLGPIALHATATGADPFDGIVAMVVGFDPQDAVRLGLTAIPTVSIGSPGAMITSGTGTGQLSVAGGVASANVTQFSGSSVVLSNGVPSVNSSFIGGQATALDANNLLKVDVEDVNGSATVESGISILAALRYIASAVAGVLSGAATSTVNVQAIGNPATNRISASVDTSGNRSSVTLS